jgi:hypothetical protein
VKITIAFHALALAKNRQGQHCLDVAVNGAPDGSSGSPHGVAIDPRADAVSGFGISDPVDATAEWVAPGVMVDKR